jgi:hypothetical protein
MQNPIPTTQFISWFDQRAQEIMRGADPYRYPTHTQREQYAKHRVLVNLGWDDEAGSGARRVIRWRNDSLTGMVERAQIEDALHRAGVRFYDVYPDLEIKDRGSGIGDRVGQGRLLTDRQVEAAHVLYVRQKMTGKTLAALLWERFGYASQESCRRALLKAFKKLALPLRECAAITLDGGRCGKVPAHGSDHCVKHGESDPRRFVVDPVAKEQVRGLVEGGSSFWGACRELEDVLPWSGRNAAKNAAVKLARIAEAEGWHPGRRGAERVAALEWAA